MALVACKAVVCSVPVLTLMGHLALVDPYGLPARVTVFGEHAVKTAETVRPALAHDVALTAKLAIALETGEMEHVPGAPFGLSAFVGQDNLKSK